MKKSVFYLSIVILFGAILFTSCEKEDHRVSEFEAQKIKLSQAEIISISHDNHRELSESEVLEVLLNFQKEQLKETFSLKSTASNDYLIKLKYYVSDTNSKDTYLKSSNEGKFVLPIYEIEIKNDTDKGVAYVSADSRYPNVLAYIPNALNKEEEVQTGKSSMLKYSEKVALSHIEAVEFIKDSLRATTLQKIANELQMAVRDIDMSTIEQHISYDEKNDLNEVLLKANPIQNPPMTMSQKGPLASITWEQTDPYNSKLPNLPSFSDMHFPAGCGVIAGATLLSIVQPAMTVSSININWAYLMERPKIVGETYGWGETPDPQDKLDMVAYFIKDVYYGTYTSTSFENDAWFGESSTTTANLINYLRKHINIDDKQPMNLDNQLNSLNYYRPILMGGIHDAGTAEKGSHAWVIDGYRICKKSTRQIVKVYDLYFHANMGWGGTDDGYYLVGSDVSLTFNTGLGEYNANLWQMCNARSK